MTTPKFFKIKETSNNQRISLSINANASEDQIDLLYEMNDQIDGDETLEAFLSLYLAESDHCYGFCSNLSTMGYPTVSAGIYKLDNNLKVSDLWLSNVDSETQSLSYLLARDRFTYFYKVAAR